MTSNSKTEFDAAAKEPITKVETAQKKELWIATRRIKLSDLQEMVLKVIETGDDEIAATYIAGKIGLKVKQVNQALHFLAEKEAIRVVGKSVDAKVIKITASEHAGKMLREMIHNTSEGFEKVIKKHY